MAKAEKQKKKLIERIEQLESELRLSLQKKAAGKAIDVPSYVSQISALKSELLKLEK